MFKKKKETSHIWQIITNLPIVLLVNKLFFILAGCS